MNDYIPLGPDETIREGDIFDTPHRTFVMPVIGSKASDYPNLRLKRPRSIVIRDAAIDLVKRLYYSDERIFYDWSEVSELMDAVGVTVDDLAEVME